MIVVLLGAPGAGKGTQAVRLAEALGVPHVSTGDLFRQHLAAQSPLGRQAEAYMNRGALVPDEVVIGMVREQLAMPEAASGMVLDGFPRTVAQAEALDAQLAEAGAEPVWPYELAVERDALVGRLTGRRVCRAEGHIYHVDFRPPRREGVCDEDGSELYQRADDSLETVANRLDVYVSETAPVIDYYRRAGRLTSVNGDGAPDAVAACLLAAVRRGTSSTDDVPSAPAS